VDASDLISIGTEELVRVARRYDEAQNDSFWGYAKKRIYGSLLDYLRTLDVYSRGDRKIIKTVESAINKYENTHYKEPSDKELSDILSIDIEKVKDARLAIGVYSIMPITEQMQLFSESDTQEIVQQEELVDIIRKILTTLPQKEQMVIQLYYFEELKFKEISEILDITESRISQIHKSVIEKIRKALGEDNG
jgi:RNA polymerase sigma factor for flagellar operon FliA